MGAYARDLPSYAMLKQVTPLDCATPVIRTHIIKIERDLYAELLREEKKARDIIRAEKAAEMERLRKVAEMEARTMNRFRLEKKRMGRG